MSDISINPDKIIDTHQCVPNIPIEFIKVKGSGWKMIDSRTLIHAVNNCFFCGIDLFQQITPKFKDYLLKTFEINEKQIDRAWRIAVSIFFDPSSNKIIDNDLIEHACRDIIKSDSHAIKTIIDIKLKELET